MWHILVTILPFLVLCCKMTHWRMSGRQPRRAGQPGERRMCCDELWAMFSPRYITVPENIVNNKQDLHSDMKDPGESHTPPCEHQ